MRDEAFGTKKPTDIVRDHHASFYGNRRKTATDTFREYMDSFPTLPKASTEEVDQLASLLQQRSFGLLNANGARSLAYGVLLRWRKKVLDEIKEAEAGHGKEAQHKRH